MRGLVDSVTLTPIDGGFEIQLVGEIAKMIALPDNSGGTKVGEYASSVKVVAGARNRLYLLIFAAGLPKIA